MEKKTKSGNRKYIRLSDRQQRGSNQESKDSQWRNRKGKEGVSVALPPSFILPGGSAPGMSSRVLRALKTTSLSLGTVYQKHKKRMRKISRQKDKKMTKF